jgi:hypothetical protein
MKPKGEYHMLGNPPGPVRAALLRIVRAAYPRVAGEPELADFGRTKIRFRTKPARSLRSGR